MLGPRHILLVPSFLQLVSRCRRTSRCIALMHTTSRLSNSKQNVTAWRAKPSAHTHKSAIVAKMALTHHVKMGQILLYVVPRGP